MLPPLAPTELIELFRRMWLVRRFEERLIALAGEGEPFGHFHVYVGQEAIGIPALASLTDEDLVFTTHRNHGHLLARGVEPARLFAEILGRASGVNGGKGGTLHGSAPELGIPHTSAVVGGAAPIAAGAALAQRRRGTGRVTMCFFGDGAMEEGAVFEALNLAALWQLPVIFVCENNTSGALSPAAGGYPGSVTAASDLGAIPRSVGVPALSVDGTDAAAVFGAAADAVSRARGGGGPTFVEAIVERWPGSKLLWPTLPGGETELRFAWAADAAAPELAGWHRDADGVLRYVRELLDARVADRDALEALDVRTRADVETGLRLALASPDPDRGDAFTGVFAAPREIAASSCAAPDAAGRVLTFAEALVEAIEQLMAEDDELVVIGSYLLGLGPWRAHYDRLRETHGERILDPPIAELAFCGVGLGAALTRLPTLVDIGTASFGFQAFPQVANEAANAISMSGGRLRIPVVFHFLHGLRGGGGAQHSHSLQAMLWNTPGLQIMLPSTPADVKGLLRTAFASESPTVFADHSKLMTLTGEVPTEPYAIPFGVAEVRRAGGDATLVATSYAVCQALAAADLLAAEGIEVEVIDPRTLVPLDAESILASVARTGRAVVVDETHRSCGVASEIAAIIVEEAFESLRAPVRRVAVPDVPIPFSRTLESELELSPERIAAAVRSVVGSG
ncbi:MAG: alpha-ketoacid dehydrogenase subunit alpha/beta [Solirubrobacteraceae bacterium]